MLDAARRREIDVVLVWRLDRWGRSLMDLVATLQELTDLNVSFVSLTEALDLTTSTGRAMAGMLAVFAAFEHDNTPRTGSCGLSIRQAEWQEAGSTSNSGIARCADPQTASRWHQQIRDRSTSSHRAHLGSSDSTSNNGAKGPIMFERLRSFVASIRRRSLPRVGMSIRLQESGFLLQPTDQPADEASCLKWQEITTIIAFKKDCFSCDLICLAIADNLTVVEINEEDAGWDAFIQAAQKNLPGLVPADIWRTKVAQPPFATNSTTIYRKDQSSS